MNEPNQPSLRSRLGSAYKALFPAVQQKPDFGPKLQNPVGSAVDPAPIARPPTINRRPPPAGGASGRDDRIFQGNEPFLSPGTPLDPRMPAGESPRRFQTPPGYNIQISPRSTESITFSQLRAMGEYTLVRIIVEHVKESLKSHEWDIVPDDDREKAESFTPEIKMLREFFEMPDHRHNWDEWLGELIEEVLVVDALSIYKRKTRGGDIFALEIIDGATIKVLSDANGFEPMPPTAAYQQFLYGVPYLNLTRDDFYYLPRNRRANKYYGYGPVEQAIVTVNQGLRRELYSLAQLTDGNIPAGLGELPQEWKMEDVKAYEDYWNTILAGDPQNRARIKFVPQGFNYTKLHEGTDGDGMGIFSPFDEWVARILCFTFGVSPMPFIKLTNRSVAQEMGDSESEGGVGSLKLFIERFINRVIKYDFKIDHLVFNWVTDRSRMQAKRVDRNVKYVGQGIFQIDEVRSEEGKDPLGLPPGYPTPTGYVTFDGSIAQEKAGLDAQNAQTKVTLKPPTPPPSQQPKDQDQADAVSNTRESKAQKAWERCRLEELDKWERFALARKGKVEKMVGFEPEFLTRTEADLIRQELQVIKPGAEKSFDDEVKHIFQYRRAKVQPIRLAPAAARDAAHYTPQLSNVLTAAFQREAQRIAKKSVTVIPKL